MNSDNNVNDFIQVTEESINNLDKFTSWVSSPSAGAVSTFSGTTRDNFNGKKVLTLEYEAYAPMAEKEMQKIAQRMRQQWPGILKIAMVHRVGRVDIGETSVVVAVSSPHRREALEATGYGIDEIKAVVPVWKREVYEDGSVWKENAESRLKHGCCAQKRDGDLNHHNHQHHHHHHHTKH